MIVPQVQNRIDKGLIPRTILSEIMETEVFALDSRSVFLFATPFSAKMEPIEVGVFVHTNRPGLCACAVFLE